jgi:hypothetical protein
MAECRRCGGPVPDDAETCSDVCAKIVAGTHWPHQSGPVTHEEMLGWMEEQAEVDALAEARQVALEAKRA